MDKGRARSESSSVNLDSQEEVDDSVTKAAYFQSHESLFDTRPSTFDLTNRL